MHKKYSVMTIISYLVSHASSRKLVVKRSMIFVYRGIYTHKRKKCNIRIWNKQENDIHRIEYYEKCWGKRFEFPLIASLETRGTRMVHCIWSFKGSMLLVSILFLLLYKKMFIKYFTPIFLMILSLYWYYVQSFKAIFY